MSHDEEELWGGRKSKEEDKGRGQSDWLLHFLQTPLIRLKTDAVDPVTQNVGITNQYTQPWNYDKLQTLVIPKPFELET